MTFFSPPTTADRAAEVGVLGKSNFLGAFFRSIPSVAYTLLWNVSGHPAITVGQGLASDNLPVSVQLIASRKKKEAPSHLFETARGLEA